MTQLQNEDWDFYGMLILKYSRQLKFDSACLRIKAAVSNERSELMLEKYKLFE